MKDSTEHTDFREYLLNFIDVNISRCKQGVLCDEELMVELVKLKAKVSKEFIVSQSVQVKALHS
jgi:hypothetical protein